MQPVSVWEPPDGKGAAHTALRWTVEQLSKDTPSRHDGVSEEDERSVRFETCECARNTVRELLRGSANADMADGGEINKSVQMLACNYVQLFFQFTSVLQESTEVVGVSAAFCACKVGDIPRKMRDLLRTHNWIRSRAGEPELAEEETKALEKKIVKTEFAILRIVVFHVDIELPLNHLDRILDKMLTGVTTNSTWIELAAKVGKNAVTYAMDWKPELLQAAKAFLADQFTGITPLICPTAICAAGAALMAVRYKIRQFPKEHLMEVVLRDPLVVKEASRRGDDARTLLETSISETLNIFKVKTTASMAPKSKTLQRTLPRRQSSAACAPALTPQSEVAAAAGNTAVSATTSKAGSASAAPSLAANANHSGASVAADGEQMQDAETSATVEPRAMLDGKTLREPGSDAETSATVDTKLDPRAMLNDKEPREPGTNSTTAATVDPSSSAKSLSDDNAEPVARQARTVRSPSERYQPY